MDGRILLEFKAGRSVKDGKRVKSLSTKGLIQLQKVKSLVFDRCVMSTEIFSFSSALITRSILSGNREKMMPPKYRFERREFLLKLKSGVLSPVQVYELAFNDAQFRQIGNAKSRVYLLENKVRIRCCAYHDLPLSDHFIIILLLFYYYFIFYIIFRSLMRNRSFGCKTRTRTKISKS